MIEDIFECKLINKDINDILLIYDIDFKNDEIKSECNNNRWNKIRGYNKNSSFVSTVEIEIEETKYVLNWYIPKIIEDYYHFEKLCESLMSKNPQRKIKPITRAYEKIINLHNTMSEKLKYYLNLEFNFTEKQQAWYDFKYYGTKWFLDNLKSEKRFDYIQEAKIIISKFGLKS